MLDQVIGIWVLVWKKAGYYKGVEGLQTMRNLGRNMAWLLKSLEVAKDFVLQPQTTVQI